MYYLLYALPIRVHIVAQRANRYIVAFHIAISYDYLLICSLRRYGE